MSGDETEPAGSPAEASRTTGDGAVTDAVDTVVAPLLADHPEAVFYAIGADGVIVPMPDSVQLPFTS